MAKIDTKLDAAQVIKQAYDEPNKRIRVDAAVSATISDVKIEDTDGDILEVNPDGSLNVNIISPIDIDISAADGDNIAISDGTNTLEVNPDGSINVNTVDSTEVTNIYDEVTAVANGISTVVLDYTLPANRKLEVVSVAGTNIAMYELLIDNAVQSKKYTYFGGQLNADFNMSSLSLATGQNIKIVVTHSRPDFGDFNTNILLKG